MERKYDLGNGVIVVASKHHIRVETRTANSSRSFGVQRPFELMPDLVDCVISLDDKYYYPHDYTVFPNGWWLGRKRWDNLEEMQFQQKTGIDGKCYVQIAVDGKLFYREMLLFAFWDVKSKRELHKMDKNSEEVKDYIAILKSELCREERQFNEDLTVVAPGWTLKKLIEKIGPWEDVQEIPPVKLEL